MSKGSTRRHARAESARHVAAAERSIKAEKYADAVGSLLAAARLVPDDADVLGRLGRVFVTTGRLREAVEILRRAIALRPEDGELYARLGIALSLSGDDESAIVECREAVRLSPALVDTHARLGDMLHRRGRRSEAAAAYEQAAAIEPTTARGRLLRALARASADRLAEAEEELRELVAIEPSDGKAFHLLGIVLQGGGRLAEAAQSFERAIDIDPLNAGAYQGVVASRKFTPEDRPWLDRIVAQLERDDWRRTLAPVEVDNLVMTFHFAAGKVCDDLGDYSNAMRHFDAANVVRRRMRPFNRDAVEARLERITRRFTPQFFAKNQPNIGDKDRTPILILGLPRSGTSLLERIVSGHPRVRGCGELDFWIEQGPRWAEAEPAALQRVAGSLRADYLRLLRGRDADIVRATDKMPFNFYWVGFIHLLFPNAVFVHCRRNPADTCISIYTTQFIVPWDFAGSLQDLSAYHGLYRRFMDHWRSVIPADRLLEVDYEDVVADPEKAARSILAFSGLDWDPACLHPELNPQAITTASHWQARQPIYRTSVNRFRHYEPWLRELGDAAGPVTASVT